MHLLNDGAKWRAQFSNTCNFWLFAHCTCTDCNTNMAHQIRKCTAPPALSSLSPIGEMRCCHRSRMASADCIQTTQLLRVIALDGFCIYFNILLYLHTYTYLELRYQPASINVIIIQTYQLELYDVPTTTRRRTVVAIPRVP